eukprot:2325245-Lingulodinium_polyedra.AAC.1
MNVGTTSSNAWNKIPPRCEMLGSRCPGPLGPVAHLSGCTLDWKNRTTRPTVSGADSNTLCSPHS